MEISKVGVIGSGTMGSGIAQVCALSGYEVVLVDDKEEQLQKATRTIGKSLARQVQSGVLGADTSDQTLKRIRTTVDLREVREVHLVVEAVVEDLAVKKQLFSSLGEICSERCIFASNTSSLPITDLASATRRADKFIGIHFMNPVPVIKGVEVIRGRKTSEETYNIAVAFVESLRKVPSLAVDYAGFITSRLLNTYLNEAAYAVMDGNAPEEVDKTMVHCTNMPIGPCKLMDMVGIDVIVRVLAVLQSEFGERFRCAPLLKQMVRGGETGVKSGKGFYEY